MRRNISVHVIAVARAHAMAPPARGKGTASLRHGGLGGLPGSRWHRGQAASVARVHTPGLTLGVGGCGGGAGQAFGGVLPDRSTRLLSPRRTPRAAAGAAALNFAKRVLVISRRPRCGGGGNRTRVR
jgi:hypothetical protein